MADQAFFLTPDDVRCLLDTPTAILATFCEGVAERVYDCLCQNAEALAETQIGRPMGTEGDWRVVKPCEFRKQVREARAGWRFLHLNESLQHCLAELLENECYDIRDWLTIEPQPCNRPFLSVEDVEAIAEFFGEADNNSLGQLQLEASGRTYPLLGVVIDAEGNYCEGTPATLVRQWRYMRASRRFLDLPEDFQWALLEHFNGAL